MLSVSSSSSTPMIGWSLENAMFNNGLYDHSELQLATAATGYIDEPTGGDQTEGRNGDVKKVKHNASERQRRKKINELYLSLRSLLPANEQSRRMSIPTTVAKVLKYIPELQEEVERMEKKKQAMSKKIDKIREQVTSPTSILKGPEHNIKETDKCSKGNIFHEKSNLSSVSTIKVGDREVVIQVSTLQISVPKFLRSLEEDGFQLTSVSSSSEYFGERVFLNLHLQKPSRIEKMEYEGLDQKLQSMLDTK